MSGRWVPAYVGLGANLDDPKSQVLQAFEHIATLPSSRLIARSRRYCSRPMGPQDQPDFVNAAASLLTQLDARSLLGELKRIERRMGREPPPVRWGPRRIDLDLLMYGSMVSADADLLLPHPGVAERSFVLIPLAEIAPDLNIPGHGSAITLARRLGAEGLSAIDA